MPRAPIRYAVADLSALARSLHAELTRLGRAPGHVELLNLLARAAGFRNYQHLRATTATEPADEPVPVPVAAGTVDHDLVEKVARHFDAEGLLLRWPPRAKQSQLCLWVLWSRIPADTVLNEREISDLLRHHHTFGDHALLRRALFDARLVTRTVDGRQYRRLEQSPPAELRPLLQRIGG